ncbi:ATP-dependent helicase, partial [Sulfolobus sp. A20-N-F8]
MLEEFEEIVRKKLGFEIYAYQKSISQEIMKSLDTNRFVVVSMPTGSGKTLIEVFIAYYLIKKGHNVIILEPTRLLCDQMYHRFWKRIFESDSGVEYEGDCK